VEGCRDETDPDCNDGVGCTDDTCNEANDECDNVPDNGNCDDGLWCNGPETCSSANDCQAGSSPDCNDKVGCTDDTCDETDDTCDNTPDDGNCSNGQFCDGVETCHPTNDCQAGAAVDCDDDVGCTDDTCNEATDSCDNDPDDGSCDNNQYCDGEEICDPVDDCQSGAAIVCDDDRRCTDDTCDEGSDSCDFEVNCTDSCPYCDVGHEICRTDWNVCVDCNRDSDCISGYECNDNVCEDECAGKEYAGYCWYLGGKGQSCTTVCSSHGGYHNATRDYAGWPGGNPGGNCITLLDVVSAPYSTTYYTNQVYHWALGCFFDDWDNTRYYNNTVTTTSGASEQDSWRVCACNR
jgi:hypothetical protein